ncbi:MAG: thioredoxin family protein [Spirochaetes bacterium]|nr:thioredoxin family protein [Spirochaetota bacterium]
MLNEEVKQDVKKQFESLQNDVRLVVFTQKVECQYCAENRTLSEEVAGLSDKLSLEIYDFVADSNKADQYGVDKIPATVIIGRKDHGIRFFGIPAGYEFTSYLEAIKLVSTGETGLSDKTKAFLDGLERDVHLQVFVTPTCPHCPSAVVLAHKLAFYSDRVRADMVEAIEFPHLSVKYEVQGVPRTVINENVSQEGAAPEALLVKKIMSALQ